MISISNYTCQYVQYINAFVNLRYIVQSSTIASNIHKQFKTWLDRLLQQAGSCYITLLPKKQFACEYRRSEIPLYYIKKPIQSPRYLLPRTTTTTLIKILLEGTCMMFLPMQLWQHNPLSFVLLQHQSTQHQRPWIAIAAVL